MPLRVLTHEKLTISEETEGFFRVFDLIEFWQLKALKEPGLFYLPWKVSGYC